MAERRMFAKTIIDSEMGDTKRRAFGKEGNCGMD